MLELFLEGAHCCKPQGRSFGSCCLCIISLEFILFQNFVSLMVELTPSGFILYMRNQIILLDEKLAYERP